MGVVALHRARFAKRHELSGLLHTTSCADGVLLGTRRDYLLFKRFVAVRPTPKRREIGNTLVVAPTRAGKGLLAISQLLSWQHSVIVNDIKGELFAATAGYRATLGDVYVLDPTGVGHCYDPLFAKKTEDDLLSAA
ncbi:MAG TPA: type IV secretory system conjugative DNA transfer family protein, partial [Ktedonobacteraceae bacterium]|nr:type IV secretory system conjugative DNA transfer family protein [Ktedonobacteraceae bacterium]